MKIQIKKLRAVRFRGEKRFLPQAASAQQAACRFFVFFKPLKCLNLCTYLHKEMSHFSAINSILSFSFGATSDWNWWKHESCLFHQSVSSRVKKHDTFFSSAHRCTLLLSPVTLWLSVGTTSSPASESSGEVRFKLYSFFYSVTFLSGSTGQSSFCQQCETRHRFEMFCWF